MSKGHHGRCRLCGKKLQAVPDRASKETILYCPDMSRHNETGEDRKERHERANARRRRRAATPSPATDVA